MKTATVRASAAIRATRTIRTGRIYVLFHEHFCGDTGRGLGAPHQTGWTALITRCMNMVRA